MNTEHTTEPIRIVLIDDHTLFRSGIKALLARKEGFEVIGEASDGLSGVKLVEQAAPDVVLLDLDMPVMNGREALAQILSSRPGQTVVMLTVSEDSEDLTECMRLGARGFLLKNIHAEFLTESIKKAADGDNVFSPEMTARLVQSLINPGAPAVAGALDSLTQRELEILGHLAAGRSNKVIARKLDLAESTIKVHVQNILRKLELTSRVQAAVYAVQHNVPQPQD
ncbi:response regulator transcription factor [Neisseria sp.]|uniref:response regulator n=1 Tax=Neisseria sp. TaxID=192066 RepID=UPI0026DDC753|nr:response regulator transcription factor [Neisseria sp.]MDO4907989.1 response regulator transcription factor [Neisseria sp.]